MRSCVEILCSLSTFIRYNLLDAPGILLGMSHSGGLRLEFSPADDGFRITDCYGRFIEIYEHRGTLWSTLNDDHNSNSSLEIADQAKARVIYDQVVDQLLAA